MGRDDSSVTNIFIWLTKSFFWTILDMHFYPLGKNYVIV